MVQYYLQVEAVNLTHTVYDTHDISTIRGGSFLLLDVMRRLADHFEDRLVKIATAASQGIFAVKAGVNPKELEPAILSFLQQQTAGHATFLVAVEPALPDNFSEVLERLQAQIRRKQWRMPTVTIPNEVGAEEECYLDGWRPGTVDYAIEGRTAGVKISAATKFRRDQGVRLKHQLLTRILRERTYGDTLNARDLGELATHPKMGVLNGKIAYIHVDGNSFGRIRREVCRTPETRHAFDEQIQAGCREPFLRALLEQIDGDRDFLTQDQQGRPARRLEVLLWGGDEMTLIVPAWRGWQVLDLFYQYARTLTFEGVELSHRAVLIFCHHNTPILQIRRIADELLTEARNNIKKSAAEAVKTDATVAGMDTVKQRQVTDWLANHKHGNAIHYLALESFDMLRGSLSGLLKVYYRKPLFQTMLFPAADLKTMLDDLHFIQANVPRGKVLKVIDALQNEYLFSFVLPYAADLEISQPTATNTPAFEQVSNSLDKRQIPAALRDQFQTHLALKLSTTATITIERAGQHWQLTVDGTHYMVYQQDHAFHVYYLRDEEELKRLGDEVLASVALSRVAQVRSALARVLAIDYDHWYWIADLWDYVPEWKV